MLETTLVYKRITFNWIFQYHVSDEEKKVWHFHERLHPVDVALVRDHELGAADDVNSVDKTEKTSNDKIARNGREKVKQCVQFAKLYFLWYLYPWETKRERVLIASTKLKKQAMVTVVSSLCLMTAWKWQSPCTKGYLTQHPNKG